MTAPAGQGGRPGSVGDAVARELAAQVVRAATCAMLLAWGDEPAIVAVSAAMAERLGAAVRPGRSLVDLAPAGSALARKIAARRAGGIDHDEPMEIATAEGTRLRVRLVALQEGGTSGVLVTAAEAEQPGAAALETGHRMRNALGVIRSLVRRTAATSTSLDEFAMHLEGRIDALARVQTLSPAQLAAGIDLATLVADELNAAAVQEGRQLQIDGPPIRLQPQAAATLALAMHELATNALKFGALSTPDGQVAVRWTVAERDPPPPVLMLDWQERAAPPGPAAEGRGFGMDLMERTLAYELKARATRTLAADGLAWRIELPLSPRVLTHDPETPPPAG